MKKSVIYLVLCSLLWSCGGIFIKLINLSPFAIAGWRSFISFIFLSCVTKKLPEFYVKLQNNEQNDSHSQKIDIRSTVNLLLGGIFYALTLVTFVVATKYTTAANAILLQYTNSIYIILLAPFLLKEKNELIDYIVVFGLIIGMVFLVGGNLSEGSIFGNVFALLSGFTYGMTTIFLRRQKSSSPIESLKLSNLFSFLICLYFMIQEGLPDFKSMIFLFVLGIFQIGCASLLFAEGVKGVNAMSSAVITMIEPLMNPVWVAVFYGEIPSFMSIIGGFIILGFIIIHLGVKESSKIKKLSVI